MIWIGLTGGIASGKSSVTRLLRERGFDVICADELAREAVAPGTEGYTKVVGLFGPLAVTDDGSLNRKEIGRQVFSDQTLRSALEAIIHPSVRALAALYRSRLQAKGRVIAFYDVPLLFEKSMEPSFDQIIVVTCDPSVQKARLMSRDGYDSDEADRRILAQLPLLDKIKRAHYVIDNNGSIAQLANGVESVLQSLGQLVAKKN